jgi:two-component system CheB/CheR fusion protein
VSGVGAQQRAPERPVSVADEMANLGQAAILSLYGPVSLLVSLEGDILHFFGDASPYMKIGGGEGPADFKLLSIVRPELRAELRALLHRAQRGETPARGMLHDQAGDGTRCVRLSVHSLSESPGGDGVFLVSFEEREKPLPSADHGDADGLESANRQIGELEQELKTTKQNLQTVIEELETSNEELQSVNEELQASNEELQASNEELETSNEELQATNEELTTVNDEVNAKALELADAYSEIEAVLDNSSQGIIVVDRDLHVIRHNRPAQEMFRLEPAGSHQHLLATETTFDGLDLQKRLLGVLGGGAPTSEEVRAGAQSYLMQVRAKRSADDRINGAVISFTDLTDLRAAEREAVAQGERAQVLIENSMDAILITDARGRLCALNNQARHYLAVSEENVIGRPVDDVFAGEGRDVDRLVKHLAFRTVRCPRKGFELTLSRSGGRTHFNAAVNEFAVEGAAYRVAMLRDVTELKRAHEEMVKAKEVADNANQAKSLFLAKMSHELRTPLNAILGFSDAMLNQTLGPMGNAKYIEYATDIHDSGHHLLELINQVLDLSKIEAGKLELNEEPLDVGEVVRAAVDLVQPLAEHAGIRIRRDVEVGLPPVTGDSLRLRQVLINLLSNAIKFSRKGSTVTVRAALVDGGALRFVVEDHGIGMRNSDVAKALSEFGQVNAFVRGYNQGSGLGLPVSRALTELHDGTLTVDTRENVGTKVTVILPAHRTGAAQRRA